MLADGIRHGIAPAVAASKLMNPRAKLQRHFGDRCRKRRQQLAFAWESLA